MMLDIITYPIKVITSIATIILPVDKNCSLVVFTAPLISIYTPKSFFLIIQQKRKKVKIRKGVTEGQKNKESSAQL
jgi:hypothetical protein